MTNCCKGICNKVSITPKVGISPYDMGLVRCKVCKIYLEKEHTIKLICQCCKSRVRTNPKNRNRKSMKILEAQLCH